MNETYIKLYRRLLDNPALSTDNNAYVVFTKLLMKVDYRTGSITLGRTQLATLCNLKPSTAYITAKRLENNSMITTQSTSKYTTFTVVNWKKYQSGGGKEQQQDFTDITTEHSKHDTIKRTKKRTKNIDTKVSIHDKDVLEAFNLWNELTGKTMRAEKSNTAAIKRLIKENKIEQVLRAIQGAVYYQTKEFRPKVFSFNTLEKKWDALNGHMDTDLKSKAGKGVDL